MAKAAPSLFACSECGYSSGRWFGRCPGCGEFGTLVEESVEGQRAAASARPLLRLVDVEVEESERIPTGVPELDRVLGGGLVPASLVLVGGEPGVGKSTLLLSALGAISRGGRRALLVTGEESTAQVKLRARLRGAGARGGGAAAARRQDGGSRALPRRPRDEGRRRRGAASARAPRGLRAAVRGRPLPRAPRPA